MLVVMTQVHDWASLAREFISNGQYRYIEIEDATASDWQSVLDLLDAQAGLISFAVDGVEEPMPRDASRLFDFLATSSVKARITIEGVIYDWRIDLPTMLSFSLHPTIRNTTEFEGMCKFVELLNLATRKRVEITLEGVSVIGRFTDSDGFVWFSGGGAAAQ